VQGQVIYGSDLYSQTLGGSDSESFYPSITRPVALEDRGLNWIFEDVAVPAAKPLGHQGSGFYHNGSDCYPYEAIPAPELGYCSHHSEESSCYEAVYLMGSRSPPFTPNLHYPYGHTPHATSPAIADEDLAAASEILGRDNWARRQSEHNVVVEKGQCIKTEVITYPHTSTPQHIHTVSKSTEPVVMLRDSHPAVLSAMVGRMYYEAGELVQAPSIASSQQPYPESMERHQTTRYSNVVNPSGVYQQPASEQPKPPIMDHLPFPEESMSPYSYATDSPSVQSPYASQSEPTFVPTPHNHRSQDRNIILASQSTTLTWVCGTKRIRSCSPPQEVDYPMPVIWSPSDSSPTSPTSPAAKKQRLSLSQTRKPLSYGPKGTWSLRSLSPLLSPRMSPAPSKTSTSSDNKLSLACLFCRGRKIACGPPPPGSDGETCK
jgi:hypothetical protein